MPLVTSADVKAIIETGKDPTPFIAAAHNALTTAYARAGVTVAVEVLTEIERWYAAHLVAIADPRITRQKIDDDELAFVFPHVRQGLQATGYGQQVVELDLMATGGILSRRTASVSVH